MTLKTAVRSNFVGISRDFATLGGNHATARGRQTRQVWVKSAVFYL